MCQDSDCRLPAQPMDSESARDEHVAEANTFFHALSELAIPGDPLVEDAVALLEAAHGAIRIAEICERLNTGQRQFNRRFRQIVGVNPKFFGQILQVNWVVGLLYLNDAETPTAIAYEAWFLRPVRFQPHDATLLRRRAARFPAQRSPAVQDIPR